MLSEVRALGEERRALLRELRFCDGCERRAEIVQRVIFLSEHAIKLLTQVRTIQRSHMIVPTRGDDGLSRSGRFPALDAVGARAPIAQ
jgi:hypothetical protein